MFDSITSALLEWARVVPLETFAFVASFIEEVLAPVPSPIVMTLTGSIAAAQEKPMAYLMVLSLIATAGKTIGALLVYGIAAQAESVIFGRFGWLFGVSHEEIVAFGKRMQGTWKDYVLLFTLRALPIMSSAVVSIGAGAIKVPMRLYVVTTIAGTVVRDAFYLYVGFTGVETLYRLVHGFENIESLLQTLIAIAVVAVFGWIVWRRKLRTISKEAKEAKEPLKNFTHS